MNYLGHAVLSGTDPQWIVGGFLGDHVRGRAWQDYSQAIAAGILLHRRLDGLLDGYPQVRTARRAFGPLRRYAGILIDMGFDHVLSRRWRSLGVSELGLDAYTLACSEVLHDHWALLPGSLRRFASFDRSHGQLGSYGTAAGMDRALRGIGMRLRRENPLLAGWPVIVPYLERIEVLFDEVWELLGREAVVLRPEMLRRAAKLPPAEAIQRR